jgi:hypothetical protein
MGDWWFDGGRLLFAATRGKLARGRGDLRGMDAAGCGSGSSGGKLEMNRSARFHRFPMETLWTRLHGD